MLIIDIEKPPCCDRCFAHIAQSSPTSYDYCNLLAHMSDPNNKTGWGTLPNCPLQEVHINASC